MINLPLPPFSWHHLHPILVNYTTALVPASIGSDLLGRVLRRETLSRAAWWMLLYAALVTPFTALLGWLWMKSMEDGPPDQIMLIHQWLGVSLAAIFIILASWRGVLYVDGKSPGIPYFLLSMMVIAALIYQGHLGGSMSFG